jgi:lipopolysaccharide heptosyltransferase II
MTIDPRWAAARHVLAVRLDNLGDVLMTTPALGALRHALPGARLALLGSPATLALAPHLQDVDEVIACAAPWMPGASTAEAGSAAERRSIDELAARGFDAAVIFTVCTQSALPAALMCRLAGIPLRLAHVRENPYGLLTDWVRDEDRVGDGLRHEVVRQLDLVAAVGVATPATPRLRFARDPRDDASLRHKLVLAGGDPALPWLIVHPGATAASRRWPAERFAAAADRIAESSAAQVVFAGSDGDRAQVDAARAAMRQPSISLCGSLNLGELAAAIAGANVLVCNNSAPAHIAAAVGTPVAVLYALTNPQHTPWQVPSAVLSHDVPCRNCLKSVCPQLHHACLLGVQPDEVAQAALALMRAARPRELVA